MIYKYKNKVYPDYLKNGNAQNYISIIAKQFCKGQGLDVGGTRDWCLDGAKFINKSSIYNAYNLPDKKYDYIFSSHTLEHLENYINALLIWKYHLKRNGVLFLYLPHPEMEYWLPQNNRQHLHIFYPKDIVKLLEDIGFKNVLYSERDMFWSFSIIGFKK